MLPDFPVDEVEFQSGGAYEVYNWELFFHIPLLIAVRLSSNQRFAEAQRWFHYIFDPDRRLRRRGPAALLADEAVLRPAEQPTMSSSRSAPSRR